MKFSNKEEIKRTKSSEQKNERAMFVPSVYADDTQIMSKMEPIYVIPKIVHFMWKTENLPDGGAKNIEAWQKLYPEWRFVLWTDTTMKHFRDTVLRDSILREFLISLPQSIMRVDAFRYVILHLFGGVYADLDVCPKRSMELLLSHHSCVIAREPEPYTVSAKMKTTVMASNFLMASRPGHPFWLFLLKNLFGRSGSVFDRVGPGAVSKILAMYSKHARAVQVVNAVFLAPSIYFSPPLTNYGDQLHIEILKRFSCPQLWSIKMPPFARYICAVLALENRIDWKSVHRKQSYFHHSFSYHFMAHSYFDKTFKCRDCPPGYLSVGRKRVVNISSPLSLLKLQKRTPCFH